MGLATQMMKEVADLIRLGFPESTAAKIASGELPMDTASRMQRAEEQGYDVDSILYHQTGQDFDEFIPGGPNAQDDQQAVFFRLLKNDPAMNAHNLDSGPQRTMSVVSKPMDYLHTNFPTDKNEDFSNLFPSIINAEDAAKLKSKGHNSVYNESDIDGIPSEVALLNPDEIRSTNAAFDPDYKGSNLLGEYALPAGSTALMASLLAAPEEAEAGFVTRGGRELLEAWHGSPHEFDRFSMDAIGTGEGAQAYGHGLYMADAQDVAKGYRDSLTTLHGKQWSLGDESVPGWIVEAVDDGGADTVIADFKRRAADAEKLLAEGTPQPHIREQQKAEAERMIGIVNRLASGEKATAPGHLYRTEIDVTPDQLLDWDKPLSEQPRAIQNIATESTPEFQGFIDELAGINPEAAELAEKMMYGPESVRAGTEEAYQNWERLGALVGDSDIDLNRLHDVTDAAYGRRDKWGATFYEELASSPVEASSLLSDRGIKGIKYLDGNSRYRPMRDVKEQFLNELPEDAEIDDVIELLDGDTFSPENKTLLQSLAADDWLGFDYPSQSLSAVLGDNLSNYDASPELTELVRAIKDKPENTSNYVIFDDKLISIAERGAATPGMMALLGAGGAGATAAGSESNAVTEATSRIVNHMLDNVTEVTDLLEIPQRGIQGLLRAGYGLMQGDGLDASLNAGADVVNQGVEETAKQAGDAMLERTGNPELATMAYTAVMLGSPI